jgi:HEPN domain-containing protein
MNGWAREAKRWILQALDDLKFVSWVRNEGVFFDKGCFLAQQAGEKALKACLYSLRRRKVLGHSLFEIV